jgi:hypothetical protein
VKIHVLEKGVLRFCESCGSRLADRVQCCAECGSSIDDSSVRNHSREKVLGAILFGGYYRDVCFTDIRLIQFEVMRDRWKFVLKAIGSQPLVIDTNATLDQVLPFMKAEISRSDIDSINVKCHGRVSRGRIRVTKKSGEAIELARIDTDVDKKSFNELTDFLKSIYPEVRKSVS